jgi:hypothetical protein
MSFNANRISARNGSVCAGIPYRNFFLFLNLIPAPIFSKNTYRCNMFLNNALAKCCIKKITSYTLLRIKIEHCWIQKGRRHADVTASRLLRKNEWRKHLEWRLCGSFVSNLSKTSCIHIKVFVNVDYMNLFFSGFSEGISLFRFLRSMPAFLNPFQALNRTEIAKDL